MYIGGVGAKALADFVHGVFENLLSLSKANDSTTTIVIDKDATISFETSLNVDVGIIADLTRNYRAYYLHVLPHFCRKLTILSALRSVCFEDGLCSQIDHQYSANMPPRTKIIMEPDRAIFTSVDIDFHYLSANLQILATLNRGATIVLLDRRGELFSRNIFHYPEGVGYWFEQEEKAKGALLKLIIDTEVKGNRYQICMGWGSIFRPMVRSFAGSHETTLGGSLVDGVVHGISLACRRYLMAAGKKCRFSRKELFGSLVLVCSVTGKEYSYAGATKEAIYEPEIRKDIAPVVRDLILAKLRSDPAVAETLLMWFDADTLKWYRDARR